MLLEKKRQEEYAKRRGSTTRTVLQSVWLVITAVGAFFLVRWLDSSDMLPYHSLYNVGLPRVIPEWGIMVALIVVAVLIMQFVFVFGYILASPEGREKRNQATAHSYNQHVAEVEDEY